FCTWKPPLMTWRLLLLSLGFRRRGRAKLNAVDRHVVSVRDVAAIFREAAFHADDHADFQRVSRPTLSGEAIRTTHCTRPIGDLSGLLILDVDVEVDVRILPFNLRNAARQLDFLV